MKAKRPRAKRADRIYSTADSPERAAIVARVCERIADGVTVKTALRPEKVNRATLWRWLEEDAVLRARYERARVAQAHALAEDVIDLADAATPDTANAVRLAIDARKWYASKLAPRLFSERLELEHGGTVDTGEHRVVIYDPAVGPPNDAALPTAGGLRLYLPDNGRELALTKEVRSKGYVAR